jgi:hypothetical protein
VLNAFSSRERAFFRRVDVHVPLAIFAVIMSL